MRSVAAPLLLLTLLAAGCTTPPAPPAPRTAVTVNASFGKTWDAVIDVFASKNISIKTLDRSSGLIVAEAQSVGSKDETLADCGTVMGQPLFPNQANWNVLVRGDSSSSTIKATVRFVMVQDATNAGLFSSQAKVTDCSTKGVWESDFERRVKAAAEAKR